MPVVTRKRCHSDLLQQNLPWGTVDWKLSAAIPLAPHGVHVEVMPSPCCPPHHWQMGALESGHSSPTWELCEGQPLPGADPHQPAQALPGPWFSSWPTLPPRLLSPPHLPIPAPSPFVLHRDFSLRVLRAVNLLLASRRTWTDRTPTHQILRQFSNVFIKTI